MIGWFAFAKGGGDLYAAPAEGFLYYKLKPGEEAVCRKEWADFKATAGAGAGAVLGFGFRYEQKGRLRKNDEKPSAPDIYPTGMGLQKTRRTDFEPVSTLVKLAGGQGLTQAANSRRADPARRATVQPGDTFPPGRYVFCDGTQLATAGDTSELKSSFNLKPDQYILSGGPEPTDAILVDDDLTLSAGGKDLFIDDDWMRSDDARRSFRRTAPNRSYDGSPLVFQVKSGRRFRIHAVDTGSSDAAIGALYLHRHDGKKSKLSDAVTRKSGPELPHTFFDREFDLEKIFTQVRGVPATPAAVAKP